MEQTQIEALVNVKKCYIVNERTNECFDIADTADTVDVEPIMSEGKRVENRVKNTIIAIDKTQDIVIGYKLKLKDNVFNLKIMQLVDGGTITPEGKYMGIPAGQAVDKAEFTLKIITERKDYSRTIGYKQFIFKHCLGKVPKFKIKDGEFIAPEFEAESYPFRGDSGIEIETLDTIPSIDNIVKPDTKPDNTTPDMKVKGDKITDSNKDVGVEITSNIKWTFNKQINQDDVTLGNFRVYKKTLGGDVAGNVTIDSTKKIVTFVPTSIEKATAYVAEAKAINLLDGSGKTTPIQVEFTTV